MNYVTAIARHGNFTRAAEELHISQSALSQYISGLEDELGLKLFERSDRKYIPTYAGRRYLDYARSILDMKANLDAELADIIKRDVGVLNIGMTNMRFDFMLPKPLPVLNRRYPNVKVNVFEGTSDAIDAKLIEGYIDLAFYSKPRKKNPHLDYETLAPEELLICTCRNHRLKNEAVKGRLKLSSVKGERLILLSPEQRTGQLARHYLKKNGIPPDNSITTNNMPAVISLTEQGWGVSFIFESHLRWHSPEPEIDTYSFDEGVYSDFVAAMRKGSYLPVYARNFISEAKKLYA